MTDEEMTRLCAEAMGELLAEMSWDRQHIYDPLHNDAQAMALVKKARLSVSWNYMAKHWRVEGDARSHINADLNRAIVECVAKTQKGKA